MSATRQAHESGSAWSLVGAASKTIVGALAGRLGLFRAARLARVIQTDVQALLQATTEGEEVFRERGRME